LRGRKKERNVTFAAAPSNCGAEWGIWRAASATAAAAASGAERGRGRRAGTVAAAIVERLGRDPGWRQRERDRHRAQEPHPDPCRSKGEP